MMTNKDRLLRVRRPFSTRWGWLHHIDVCDNSPRTSSRAKALRLTMEMAETIRFNLTARGWSVSMAFEN